MTVLMQWKCLKCKNYVRSNKCVAFPDGIPQEIWTGDNKHVKPLKSQGNNIVFELLDSKAEKAGFDPNQARDETGQWSDTGAGSTGGDETGKPGHTSASLSKQIGGHNQFDGSTYLDGKDMAYTDGYFSVSTFPERSLILPKGTEVTEKLLNSYLEKNKDLFSDTGKYGLGTWLDTDDGKVYIDVISIIKGRAKALFFVEKAIQLGIDHNQIAIFDLGVMDTIPTGGTGK